MDTLDTRTGVETPNCGGFTRKGVNTPVEKGEELAQKILKVVKELWHAQHSTSPSCSQISQAPHRVR